MKTRTKPNVLQAALTGWQRARGYWLFEPDDDVVELCYGGKLVARWSQLTATITEIRAAANNHTEGE